MNPPAAPAPPQSDVIIVGAGMAGLYTAWRLLRRRPDRTIRLIERLPRTGGRLESDRVVINGQPVKTEEGGMRFMDSHIELMGLLKELGLTGQVVPFPMGSDANLFYLRGQRFTLGQARVDPGIWGRIFNLNPGAIGVPPGEVLTGLLKAILTENGVDPTQWQPTPDAWTTLRMRYTYRGIPTYRWGFWAMLTDYGLSADCIEMLYQSSGFVAPYDQEINAGCALQLLVDFVDPAFHTLQGGYETLPNTLAEAVVAAGAAITLSEQVVAMERQSGGGIRVVTRGTDGQPGTYLGKEVVLAVTQFALQQLIPQVAMFRETPRFMEDVDSVTDMQLGKINLYYDRNWWTPATGISSGGSYTDLPLAQFYCFAHQPDPGPAGPASITLYTDYYRTQYWAQLQAIGGPYQVANGPEAPPYSEPASTFVVEQATRQMREMLGLGDIPAPVLATYRRWGASPAGDGDHQWRVGVDDVAVRARLANPFPNVYVCGESYSDDQAWVNGALRSADQVLAAHFGRGADLA